jgi:hypothetical protein
MLIRRREGISNVDAQGAIPKLIKGNREDYS